MDLTHISLNDLCVPEKIVAASREAYHFGMERGRLSRDAEEKKAKGCGFEDSVRDYIEGAFGFGMLGMVSSTLFANHPLIFGQLQTGFEQGYQQKDKEYQHAKEAPSSIEFE